MELKESAGAIDSCMTLWGRRTLAGGERSYQGCYFGRIIPGSRRWIRLVCAKSSTSIGIAAAILRGRRGSSPSPGVAVPQPP